MQVIVRKWLCLHETCNGIPKSVKPYYKSCHVLVNFRQTKTCYLPIITLFHIFIQHWGTRFIFIIFLKIFWKSQPWTRTLTLRAWLEEKQTCLPQTIYSVNNHNLSLLSWKLITPNTLLHIPWLPSTFTPDFTHKCSLLIW